MKSRAPKGIASCQLQIDITTAPTHQCQHIVLRCQPVLLGQTSRYAAWHGALARVTASRAATCQNIRTDPKGSQVGQHGRHYALELKTEAGVAEPETAQDGVKMVKTNFSDMHLCMNTASQCSCAT